MDAIKAAVTQTLEKQGVISQLKAQLRAQVFLAIDEYEAGSLASGLSTKSGGASRKALLDDPDGHVVIQLVLDLLDTCNFAFTKQVFVPELGPDAPQASRQAVSSELGVFPTGSQEPLLLTLVKTLKSGGSSGAASAPQTSSLPSKPPGGQTTAADAPSSTLASSSRSGIPLAPLPRLEPLGASPAKPASLGPLSRPPVSSSIPTASPASSAPASGAAQAAKPKKEASKDDDEEYSDEEFEVEDEVVEEAVEEDEALVSGPASGGRSDEDDDDYAAAMGYKATQPSASGASRDEAAGRSSGGGAGGSGKGRAALDADLMAGDRSFGMSNELAGLDAGNSGGLSFSADFPAPDTRASLSTSQALLSPISEGAASRPKLAPLGGRSAPLAPLPGIGTLSTSLSSSKDDPLGSKGPKSLAPLAGPVRKPGLDIDKEREELRRLGLLSGDSLGTSAEAELRPRPAGPPTSIYDAEVSVSASMDEGGGWGAGSSGAGPAAREDKMPFGSKGLSMDLRETGLSASDRSGDMERMGDFDLAETAEWH